MGTREEHVQIPKLIEKLYAKEIVLDTIRKWNITGGDPSPITRTWKPITVFPFYFGSRQSQLYFNFYEKRYGNRPYGKYLLGRILGDFWYLEPLRTTLSDQKAQGVVEEYINGVDLGEIARGIVNKEIQVYDGVTRFGAYKPDENGKDSLEELNPKTLNQSTALQYRTDHSLVNLSSRKFSCTRF